MYVKQSTAVVIPFGPFVDKTDGNTLETGLVSSLDHGTTGIKLSKNGGALTIRHATVTASTYDAYGNYLVTLDTTDTNTLGSLRVQFADEATCLPVWADFQVLPANVYDSLVAGTDLLDTDADADVAAIKAKTDNLPSDPADHSVIIAATDALATLIGDVPTNAELATALGTADDAVLTQIALVKAKTDLIPASPAAVGSAMVLSSTGLDNVVVETGLNARQALSIAASATGGVLAGAATNTVTIAAAGVPATNRITATVDSSGNRSSVTLNPPA